MERLIILIGILLGLGLAWLAWQAVKSQLRRGIEVEGSLLQAGRPTLLYFSSENCAPCRLQQAPIVSLIRQEWGAGVDIYEYDAVEHADLARRYRILTVPTTVVIAPGGEVVTVNYGLARLDQLRRQLLEAGAAAPDNLAVPTMA